MMSEGSIFRRAHGEEKKTEKREGAHEKTLEFVARHRDLIEHKSRGRVRIEAAPEGEKTFATDLESGTVYVADLFHGRDDRNLAATCHETLGHLKETLEMLEEEGGPAKFKRYVGRLKSSAAYGIMDNCVADRRENEETIAELGPDYRQTFAEMYQETLFPDSDRTVIKDENGTVVAPNPRHIQLGEAILRETFVPEEVCTVAPEVRQMIDELKAVTSPDGTKLLDLMAEPDLPMSERLRLQDEYVWPRVKKLLEQDLEDKKKEGGGEQSQKPADPNKVFEKEYAEARKRNPHGIGPKELDKAFREWKEHHGDPLAQAEKEEADRLGVKPENLRRYRQIAKALERIKNPQTQESIVADLEKLIERIISRRLKHAPAPQYPVEEGEELIEPGELYAAFRGGELSPKVWETAEIKEVKAKRYGEVEVTLVFDRSTSMNEGAKLVEQLKAGVFATEALYRLARRAEQESINLEKPLKISSEAYAFSNSEQDSKPIKPMSADFPLKSKIEIMETLSTAPGNRTTDYVSLDAIATGVTDAVKRKISEGELKKIVILCTDGGSNDPAAFAEARKKLLESGVIFIDIGITESARLDDGALLAKTAEQLPIVLGGALVEHLADV